MIVGVIMIVNPGVPFVAVFMLVRMRVFVGVTVSVLVGMRFSAVGVLMNMGMIVLVSVKMVMFVVAFHRPVLLFFTANISLPIPV
jgi:hypothetical protein